MDDVSLVLAGHASSCVPSQREVRKKKHCPVRGCKALLMEGMKYTCGGCGKETCLRHRFAGDHDCGRASAPVAPAAPATAIGPFIVAETCRDAARTAPDWCGLCETAFPSPLALVAHVRRVHNPSPSGIKA